MTSVKIGRQQWATEDLRVTHFRNGDPIPLAITDDHWHYMDGPLMCITVNGEHLYNWHAVNDERGLAPKGFRVPSDDQWTELVDFYGGPERAGLRLRSIAWGGHESTVFDAMPTGGRSQEDGTFRNVGWVAYWWTSTQEGKAAWLRNLASGYANVNRAISSKRSGCAVRCIKNKSQRNPRQLVTIPQKETHFPL
jgi:uncharacterized protein (TIGR02145 family)